MYGFSTLNQVEREKKKKQKAERAPSPNLLETRKRVVKNNDVVVSYRHSTMTLRMTTPKHLFT